MLNLSFGGSSKPSEESKPISDTIIVWFDANSGFVFGCDILSTRITTVSLIISENKNKSKP